MFNCSLMSSDFQGAPQKLIKPSNLKATTINMNHSQSIKGSTSILLYHMEAKIWEKNIPPEDFFGHCYKYSPPGHLHVFVWQHFHFSRIQNICFAPVDLSENGGNWNSICLDRNRRGFISNVDQIGRNTLTCDQLLRSPTYFSSFTIVNPSCSQTFFLLN